MSEPTSTPILTVTWDTIVGSRHLSYDPEDGPEIEPVSLGEMVVEQLVQRLTADVKRETRYHDAIREARDAARTAATEKAQEMVSAALAGPLPDGYGKPDTTLVELIEKTIADYLGEKANSYMGDRRGGFRELVRTEIDNALGRELREVITKARAQVIATVRETADAVLVDAVKKGLGR